MRGNDGTLYLDEGDRAKLWTAHMSKIMNDENEWDKVVDTDAVEGPIERVMREEIMKAFKYLKIGKAPGLTEVYAEMILASGDVGIRVLMELRQKIVDGNGMPANWVTSVTIPIFKGKGNIMNCGMHRGVNLLEQAMKIVEKVHEKRWRNIVTKDDMQFGFMPGKGTIYAAFILRCIQEK